MVVSRLMWSDTEDFCCDLLFEFDSYKFYVTEGEAEIFTKKITGGFPSLINSIDSFEVTKFWLHP